MSETAADTTELRPASGVVIGIPAYNEAATVGDVVRRARTDGVSVLVVDDGSDDRTAAAARAAGATVVSHDRNRGYGAALATLFRHAHEADVDHLVVVDADGQHDPEEALTLVDTQRSSGRDIVVGSRFVAGAQTDMPLYRRAGVAVINALIAVALRLGYSSTHIADTQSGFRAYSAEAIEMLACRTDLSDGMDASIDILFRAADENCTVTETPVDVSYDVAEANTHNPVVHGGVLVRNVLARVLSDRPVRVLGVPGSVCLVVGAVLSRVPLTGATLLSLLITALVVMGGGLLGAALAIGRLRPRRY